MAQQTAGRFGTVSRPDGQTDGRVADCSSMVIASVSVSVPAARQAHRGQCDLQAGWQRCSCSLTAHLKLIQSRQVKPFLLWRNIFHRETVDLRRSERSFPPPVSFGNDSPRCRRVKRLSRVFEAGSRLRRRHEGATRPERFQPLSFTSSRLLLLLLLLRQHGPPPSPRQAQTAAPAAVTRGSTSPPTGRRRKRCLPPSLPPSSRCRPAL